MVSLGTQMDFGGNSLKLFRIVSVMIIQTKCKLNNAEFTLGSRGYFFLIDISRRSRVNESQSAEEKKITSGHRSTQPHFHARSSSEIELGHRLLVFT